MANVGGLSKALYNEGCIEQLNQFRDFTLGFTQAKASFDFIDVGFGKERADAKIRGTKHPTTLTANHSMNLANAVRNRTLASGQPELQTYPLRHWS